nr:hypothetical protein [Tanacetum cinerariifolium]
MESDEFIKSSVENLVPIPIESEGVPDNLCDVPFHDNSLPLDVSKDQFEDFFDSNDESTSIDDDSFFIDIVEYVEASSLDYKLVSAESMIVSASRMNLTLGDFTMDVVEDIFPTREPRVHDALPTHPPFN